VFRRSLSTFSLLLFLLSLALAYQPVKVRYGVHKEKVRIVLDLPKKVPYRVFTLKSPYRVVIDLKSPSLRIKSLRLPKSFRYKVGKHPWGVRLVLLTPRAYKPKAFYVERPTRLVVDLYRGKARAVKRKKRKKVFKPYTIVVDPGHGGRDPGAIGYGGIREKWVNLRIAKYLAYYLNKDPRFKAVLTRRGDYFVSLRRRALIAKRHKADLFISIHADAAPRKNPRARGTTIYALSYRGAVSTKRKLVKDSRLARKLLSPDATDYRVRYILSDFGVRATLENSTRLARLIALEMKRVLKREVHFKGIRRRNFLVLKVPGTPAVLVEVGYITNPTEARRLRSPRFQKKVAYAIYRAIVRYFNFKPYRGVYLVERSLRRSKAKVAR